MRRSRSCVSLKLASTQIGERANRHQALPDLDIVARINFAAGDDAVDLRVHRRAARSQPSLREIVPGGLELRLGLLDGRGVGRELGERAVDVAQFLELVEHRFRTLVERVHDAELGGTLLRVPPAPRGRTRRSRRDRAALCRAHRPLQGLALQLQRDPDLGGFGQGLGEFRASRRQFPPPLGRTPHAASSPSATNSPRPIKLDLRQRQRGLALVNSGDPRVQQSDLAVDVLHGTLQVPAPAPRLGFDPAHRRGGRLQVRVRDVHRRLLLEIATGYGSLSNSALLTSPCAHGCCHRPEREKSVLPRGLDECRCRLRRTRCPWRRC